MPITAYLDESGTHGRSSRIMVGAIVTLSDASLHSTVDARVKEIAADNSLWTSNTKRAEFQCSGFHHNEDDDTVRDRFIETMRTLDFRAHICFSRRAFPELADTELLIVMFYSIVRNLLRRYAGQHLDLIFETNSEMNQFYGPISEHAIRTLLSSGMRSATATACIGTKPSSGLSVVDYMLALTSLKLDGEEGMEIKPFQTGRFRRVGSHMAHLVDFDQAAHRRRLGRLL